MSADNAADNADAAAKKLDIELAKKALAFVRASADLELDPDTALTDAYRAFTTPGGERGFRYVRRLLFGGALVEVVVRRLPGNQK